MILSTLALGALISTAGAARYILGGVLAMASIGIWLNAPRFVAHWSTSGELFLAQPDNDVIRIALGRRRWPRAAPLFRDVACGLRGGSLLSGPAFGHPVNDADCPGTGCMFPARSRACTKRGARLRGCRFR